MEVDGDRITDDERMDEDPDRGHGIEELGEGEDYPVGEGEGMMEDEDGDEMMGDEFQDDEEYEVAMEEENVEPIIDVRAQPEEEGEPVEAEPAPAIETPPIPFTSTSNGETSQPIVSPFPDISSVNGRTVLPRPLESPPAPETEMTPVEEQDEQPFINDLNGDEGTEDQTLHDETPFIPAGTSIHHDEGLAEAVKDKVPSPQPEQVATTQQALEVLQEHPSQQEQDEMAVPSVPEPQSPTLQIGESSKRGGSREPTPGKTQQGDHDEEYYEDGEEDEEEDYVIDANSLPPIILHLPNDQARYLFETYENDPDTLPVWLEGRQAELAEASLSDVWNAIKVECMKEGLAKNGALVVSEKQMDLKMNEDDVNLQSITFLELILLHHGCGLPEPVQLYLTWEESRFITRFNAIQTELEAMRERSESVQAQEEEVIDGTVQDSASAEQHAPKAVEKVERTPQAGNNAEQSQKVIPVGEDDEYVEEYNEDDYVEEEEIRSKQGAYSDDEAEEKYRHKTERDGRRDQRDVKAQYAESVDDEINTRDLERAHPNWAAARMKPTDALHFEGPSGKRYLNYKAEGHHEPDDEAEVEAEDEEEDQDQGLEEVQQVQHAAGTKEPDTKGKADTGGEEGDYADEEQYDDEEERGDDVEEGEGDQWNDGADTVEDNNSTIAQSKDTDTQDEMNDVKVPQPFTVPKDELELLKDRKAVLTGKTVQQLQQEKLGEKTLIEPSVDASALPTPYASAAPSSSGLEVEASTQETKFDSVNDVPLDEVALKKESEAEDSTLPTASGISTPAVSSLTPSGMDEARAIARDVLGGQRVDVIPEEDESFSDFVGRVNEDDNGGELAAPVPGGPAIGIVPDEGYFDDGEYEDTKIGNGPDTVPVTPMESQLQDADLEFFDSTNTNGDEDEAYGSDEEGTLEADSTYNPDQLELTEGTEDTLPSTSIGDSTGTEAGSGSGPLSAKRHNEDELSSDVESKRARASTSH